MGNRSKAAPVAGAFVSQAEYGRHRGVSRKTVTDWKQKGILVLDERGRVDVAKTDAALNERPAVYRGGVTSSRRKVPEVTDSDAPSGARGNKPARRPRKPKRVTHPADQDDDDEAEDDGGAGPIDLDDVDLSDIDPDLSSTWSLADATRVKEIFLALKRRQDFLVAEGKLVEIEAVALFMEKDYAVVRERLLGIPGKLAASLVGLDRAEIESRLLEEISEALSELHDPDTFAGSHEARDPD
ncbi:hypothetical protein K32_24110 [Kaistia sp. 32K]|uniref:hypothetical protein n=1 Tax=Kaistia sp. 32K TaxID=2795690 RepID=UPI001914DC7C|nr:hypothetical protein [Kaistia sp. 32K]BCP53794.1 hypothetical protein K32_24110 [Kaistia sp. 32K]